MSAVRALAGALLALLAPACAAPRGPADWPQQRAELARRVEVDQEARRALMSGGTIDMELAHRLEAIDADNTAWMKTLVARHGWPTLAAVGPEASGNAWLLVQHADQDVAFQEHCLALLEAAVARGQAEKKHLAYLHDRVAMHRGRPQRYGTQFRQVDGKLEPYTLEDPARVDEWRAEAGLGTLAEYRKVIEGL
ncbi:MAG TPA: DUF6624 domain-containing protein [Planctomycetota bacterium]